MNNHKNSEIANKIYELNSVIKQKLLSEVFENKINFNDVKYSHGFNLNEVYSKDSRKEQAASLLTNKPNNSFKNNNNSSINLTRSSQRNINESEKNSNIIVTDSTSMKIEMLKKDILESLYEQNNKNLKILKNKNTSFNNKYIVPNKQRNINAHANTTDKHLNNERNEEQKISNSTCGGILAPYGQTKTNINNNNNNSISNNDSHCQYVKSFFYNNNNCNQAKEELNKKPSNSFGKRDFSNGDIYSLIEDNNNYSELYYADSSIISLKENHSNNSNSNNNRVTRSRENSTFIGTKEKPRKESLRKQSSNVSRKGM